MLKSLKHARLTQTHEKELRALLAVDLLIVDDFGLDAMDAQESRDAHEIIFERHRAGSMIVTSNRGPDEWLATFADPVRAQAAIDRFTSQRLRPRHRGRVVPRPAQARPEGWTEGGEEGQVDDVTPMRTRGGMLLQRRGPMLRITDNQGVAGSSPVSPTLWKALERFGNTDRSGAFDFGPLGSCTTNAPNVASFRRRVPEIRPDQHTGKPLESGPRMRSVGPALLEPRLAGGPAYIV